MNPGPYVLALRAVELFSDPAYQRDVEERRVAKMADEFDARLLGVLEVSKREGGRFAILDGQHRHAVALRVVGELAMLVCQVYEGLSAQEEARLFHELNARRKALTFWDRWKSRRGAGDERVLAIERVLAEHGLQVHPAAQDGNIAATTALEYILDELGDLYLLESVVVVLKSAFGRSREAFESKILQAVAFVLAAYGPGELDRDRLVNQLAELPVRQLRVRADMLREAHHGRLPRLIAAVIVEQYNRGRGPNVEPFFTRVPEGSRPPQYRRPVTSTAPDAVTPRDTPSTAATSGQSVTVGAGPVLCRCDHARRLHEDDGVCLAGCRCAAYQPATS